MKYLNEMLGGKAMREDFARGRCPICGCETYFRKNKNLILYTYCPNGHQAKLGRDDSKQAIAAIAGGKEWNNGILYLYPLNRTGKEKDNGRDDRTSTRADDRIGTKQSDGGISATDKASLSDGKSNGAKQSDGWGIFGL